MRIFQRAWQSLLHNGFKPPARPFPLPGVRGNSRYGSLDGSDVDWDVDLGEFTGFLREDARMLVTGQSAVGGHPLHVDGLSSPSE